MGWTEERTELLKKLWANGLSASQIADLLGEITRNAVIGKVHWPIGDPQDEHFHFCGCQTNSAYSEHHARIAYQPISRRKK